MRKMVWLPTAALCSMLAACGGGGSGGVNPIPAPPPAPAPPPPPASNSTLADLQASETFASDGSSSTAQLDLASQKTVAGSAGLSTVSIHYDAPSKSYTIEAPGRAQTFTPADLQATSNASESDYQKAQGSGRDYLTLVKQPFTSSTALRYVGLGFWQRNTLSGSTQNTTFDIFAYGLATPAAAVPRSGSAAYGIDAFGLFLTPGLSPKGVQGHGQFTADFLSGTFTTSADLVEFDLTDSTKTRIGALNLVGGGNLSSSDGTFAGFAAYGGSDARVAGTLSGRFYGPAAQELGGSFAASDGKGSSLSGAFTGQRDPSLTPETTALTNIVAPQHFFTQTAFLDTNRVDGKAGVNDYSTYQSGGGLDYKADGSVAYSPGLSNLPFVTFTASDKTSSPANFTTYRKVVNGQTVELSLFTPGAANSQLPLTYSSFGLWKTSEKAGVVSTDHQTFFVYGLETAQGLLARRTGTAHYDGVLFGGGVNKASSTLYDLSGTSVFDVDFGAQAFTATLGIAGTDRSTGARTDFGNFDFRGAMGYTRESESAFVLNGQQYGRMTTRFYGPTGQEIGGSFQISAPRPDGSTTVLTGATLARTR